jgi:hypothetical protein
MKMRISIRHPSTQPVASAAKRRGKDVGKRGERQSVSAVRHLHEQEAQASEIGSREDLTFIRPRKYLASVV